MLLSLIFSLLSAQEPTLLTTKNHCTLAGEVNSQSMIELKFCLIDQDLQRGNKDYPIYLVVDSGGGEIYAGLRFIEFAKTIKNVQTVTIFAASMAAGIVEALPGKRHATENAIFMFHRAKGSFKGQFEDGELEQQLDMWKKIVRKMEQMNADRVGITLAEYKSKVINEWWIYGKDSVKQNVSDQISVFECSNVLLKERRSVSIDTFFGVIEFEESACPLVN